jgi:hypothetical protein
MEIPRYYPYYKKALIATKHLAIEQLSLNQTQIENVKKSSSCGELHSAIGKDFWVVTKLTSTSRNGEFMEGTRLTITKQKVGHEFTIRTPALPRRYPEFNDEFNYLWGKLIEQAKKEELDIDAVSDLIIRFYFYWVNYGPLTRGTAALGLIVLMALFLSFDIEVEKVSKYYTQLDFESIIGGDVEVFLKEIKEWLYEERKFSNVLDNLPIVEEVISTPRKMIQILNFD